MLFRSGDGSFYLNVKNLNSKLNDKKYSKVVLNFKICLHIRDEEVIKGLVNYLILNQDQFSDYKLTKKENGSKLIYITENTVTLHITKIADIFNIIIPFFINFSILGFKSLDFLDFCKVATLIKNKKHLTSEGFNTIENIKSKMNLRRSET